MPKPTVYVESTVMSYYTARASRDLIVAAHQEITREWWEQALPQFDAFISEFVLEEIGRGDAEAATKRLSVSEGFPILEVSQAVADLAEKYLTVLPIPDRARADAYHLATAVFHGMDYLVTWNCTHIAAGRIIAAVDAVNAGLDYATPVICTPEELMEA